MTGTLAEPAHRLQARIALWVPAPGGAVLRRVNLAYVAVAALIGCNQLESWVVPFVDTLRVQQYLAVGLAGLVVLANGLALAVRPPRGILRIGGLVLPVLGWLLLWLAWSMVSAAWSDRPGLGAQKAVALGVTSAAALLLAASLDAGAMARAFLLGLGAALAAGLAVALSGSELAFMDEFGQRFSGVFANRNGVAKPAALGLTLAAAALFAGGLRPLAAGVFGALALASIAWAGSIGAWVSVAAIPVILFAVSRPRRLLGCWALGAVLAAGLVAIALAGGLRAEGEILRIAGLELSTHNRWPIWQYALGHWLDRPWLGFGLMGFWTEARSAGLVESTGLPYVNVHNGFIHVLVVGGAVGLALLVGALARAIGAAHRMLASPARAELAVLLAFVFAFLLCNAHEYFLGRGTQFLQTLFVYCLARVAWLHAAARMEAGSGPGA